MNLTVLDTGLYLGHPDFLGRVVAAQSVIAGEEVEDLNGHGTHCIGTAAGSILDGIEWALENNCKIISLSLGSRSFGLSYSKTYEKVGGRALIRLG